MIYLVYFTKESGELLWSFRHPLAPTELIAKVAGKDDVLISGFISAISGFGSETLGDKLQSIDFEKVRLYFRYMNIDGTSLLTTVIADREDAPEAIWDTIKEFIEKNKKELLELADELSFLDSEKQMKTIAKLNKSMLNILDSKKRNIEILANRDTKTVLIGLIPTLIVFFALYLVVDWAYAHYEIFSTRWDVLLGTIVFLLFIIPSIIMGYAIGYREGARLGGLGLSAVGIVVLSLRYYPKLIEIAEPMNIVYLLPFLLLIVIFILGSAMGSLGSYVAWYFVERKTLTPPSEKEAIEGLDKLKLEEKEANKILEGIESKEAKSDVGEDFTDLTSDDLDLDESEIESSDEDILDDFFKDKED